MAAAGAPRFSEAPANHSSEPAEHRRQAVQQPIDRAPAGHAVPQRRQQTAGNDAPSQAVLDIERTDATLTPDDGLPTGTRQRRTLAIVTVMNSGHRQRPDGQAGIEKSNHQVGLFTCTIVATDTDTRIEARDRAKPIAPQKQADGTRVTAAKFAQRGPAHFDLAFGPPASPGVFANGQRLQRSVTGRTVGLGDGYGALPSQPLRTNDCIGMRLSAPYCASPDAAPRPAIATSD